MNNLNHIATYLFENPGARYTDITKMLCAKKGIPWTRGHYCRYFAEPTSIHWDRKGNTKTKTSAGEMRYAGYLWCRAPGGGWMLTIEGYGHVTQKETA
jgi:hypothetical protein